MRYSLKNEAGTVIATFNSKEDYSKHLDELRGSNSLDWAVGATYVTRYPNKGMFKLVHTKTGELVKFYKKITFSDMWHRFAEHKEVRTQPSPQYDRVRSCEVKKMHLTREIAETAAARASDKNHIYEAYKCRWCPMFHIGHRRML